MLTIIDPISFMLGAGCALILVVLFLAVCANHSNVTIKQEPANPQSNILPPPRASKNPMFELYKTQLFDFKNISIPENIMNEMRYHNEQLFLNKLKFKLKHYHNHGSE